MCESGRLYKSCGYKSSKVAKVVLSVNLRCFFAFGSDDEDAGRESERVTKKYNKIELKRCIILLVSEYEWHVNGCSLRDILGFTLFRVSLKCASCSLCKMNITVHAHQTLLFLRAYVICAWPVLLLLYKRRSCL